MGKPRQRKKLSVLAKFRANHQPPLSIEIAAEKIGVDRTTWFRWENGTRVPSRDMLPKLSRMTGIPIETLYRGFQS